MALPASIEQLLQRAARELRLRRIERGAWRGAFWGLLLAALLLAGKGWLLPADASVALMAAALAAGAALVLGTALGAAGKADRLGAARLADGSLGLQDRLATCLECAARPVGPHNLVAALIADTEDRLRRLPPNLPRLAPRNLPRETRYIALPLMAAIVLALAPALPRPDVWIAEQLGMATTAASLDPNEKARAERARLFGAELAARDRAAMIEEGARSKEKEQASAGEAATDYKDRSIRKEALDFASFAKKGDDRLRLLERADKLPDLKSDFTGSKLKQLMRESRELAQTGQGARISAGKLGQILQEMERLGRRDSTLGNEIQDAMNQLEQGNTEQAYERMQSSLERLREQDERQRDTRRLRSGRDPAQDGQEGARMDGSMLSRDGSQGEQPGGARGAAAKGKPTARLRSTPYDAGIEGAQRGGLPSYETRATNRADNDMRLQYLGEIGQYRRQMEDAISREQIPRGYHDQIRRYFNSLNDQ